MKCCLGLKGPLSRDPYVPEMGGVKWAATSSQHQWNLAIAE